MRTLDYQRVEAQRAGKVSSGLTTEYLKWQADKLDFVNQVLNRDLPKAIELFW